MFAGRDRWTELRLALHPGNSGGPVVNARGEVVGVAVYGEKRTERVFAIPAEAVIAFAAQNDVDLSHCDNCLEPPEASGDEVEFDATGRALALVERRRSAALVRNRDDATAGFIVRTNDDEAWLVAIADWTKPDRRLQPLEVWFDGAPAPVRARLVARLQSGVALLAVPNPEHRPAWPVAKTPPPETTAAIIFRAVDGDLQRLHTSAARFSSTRHPDDADGDTVGYQLDVGIAAKRGHGLAIEPGGNLVGLTLGAEPEVNIELAISPHAFYDKLLQHRPRAAKWRLTRLSTGRCILQLRALIDGVGQSTGELRATVYTRRSRGSSETGAHGASGKVPIAAPAEVRLEPADCDTNEMRVEVTAASSGVPQASQMIRTRRDFLVIEGWLDQIFMPNDEPGDLGPFESALPASGKVR